MKSEHRHELKTNELAEWLGNLPQWTKDNLKVIICVSAVVVVVLVTGFFHWYRKNVESVQKQFKLAGLITQLPRSKTQILQSQAQGFDSSYVLIQIADDLQAAARNAKDDRMAALALIKRAEALRMELHYRSGAVSEQEIAAQIGKAQASYAEAFIKAAGSPSLMAKAKFGAGLCEEELGNFAKAKQIYSDITANPNFEGTTALAQAKLRLDTMADYQQKVVFKTPPIKSGAEPAATELIQPQIKLGPNPLKASDINLPSQ